MQAISILLQNLRSPLSLYMLLSQDHINRLIQPDAGVAELELPLDDEEFVTNYVALLKAISVRLSKDTVRGCEDGVARCFGVLFRCFCAACFFRRDFQRVVWVHFFARFFATFFSARVFRLVFQSFLLHLVGLFVLLRT